MTLCSNDELAMAKLADRPLQQRDFRDLEAREVLGDAGHACENRHRDRFKHDVGRGRQHVETDRRHDRSLWW